MSNNAPDIPIQVEFDKIFTDSNGETNLDIPELEKYKEILDQKNILLNFSTLEKKVSTVLDENKTLKLKLSETEKSFFEAIEPQFDSNSTSQTFRNFIPEGSSSIKNKIRNKDNTLKTLCLIYNTLGVPKSFFFEPANPEDNQNKITNSLESIYMYPDIDCDSASLGTPQNLADLFHKHYQKGLMEGKELDKKQFLLDLVDKCYLKTYFEKDSKTKNKLEQNTSWEKLNEKFDEEFLKINENLWTNAGTGTHEFNVVGQDSFGDFVELNKVYDVDIKETPGHTGFTFASGTGKNVLERKSKNNSDLIRINFNNKNGIFEIQDGNNYWLDNDKKDKVLFLGNNIIVKSNNYNNKDSQLQLLYNTRTSLIKGKYSNVATLYDINEYLGKVSQKAGRKLTGGVPPDFYPGKFANLYRKNFKDIKDEERKSFINTKFQNDSQNDFYVEFQRKLYEFNKKPTELKSEPNHPNVKNTLMKNVPLFFDKVNTELGEGDNKFNKNQLFKVLDYHTQINNTLVIYEHFFNNLKTAVEIIIDCLKNASNNLETNQNNKKTINAFLDVFEKKLNKTKNNLEKIVNLINSKTYASIQKKYQQENVCNDQELLVKHFLGIADFNINHDTIKTLNNVLLKEEMSEEDFLNVLKSIDDLDTVRTRHSNNNTKNNQHVFAGLPYIYPVPKISKAIWIVYYFYITYRKNSITSFGEKLLKIEQNMASRIKTTDYKKIETDVKSKDLRSLITNLAPGIWEQKLDALVKEEIREALKTLKEINRLHLVPQKRKNMNRFKEYYEILRLIKLYNLKMYFYITYLYKIREYLIKNNKYIDTLQIVFNKYIKTFKYFVDLMSKTKEKLEVSSVIKEISELAGLGIDKLYNQIQNKLVYVGNFKHPDYWNEKLLIFNKYSSEAIKKDIMVGGEFMILAGTIGITLSVLVSALIGVGVYIRKEMKKNKKSKIDPYAHVLSLSTNNNNRNKIYKNLSSLFSRTTETILKPFIIARNNKTIYLIDAFSVCLNDNLSKYNISHFTEVDGKVIYNNFNPVFEIYNPKTKNKTSPYLFQLLSGSKNFYTIVSNIQNYQYFTDTIQTIQKVEGVIVGDLTKKSTEQALQNKLIPFYEIKDEQLQNPVNMRKWVYDILMTDKVLTNKNYLGLKHETSKYIVPYLVNKDIFRQGKEYYKKKLGAKNKNIDKPGVLTQRTLGHSFMRELLLKHYSEPIKSKSVQLNYQTISIVDKKFLSRYDFQKIMMGNLNVEDILHEILISPKKVFII